MNQSEADNIGWRGTNEGAKLKSDNGWDENGNGSDIFGLKILPAGFRDLNEDFLTIGEMGVFWISTEYNDTEGWYRNVASNSEQINRSSFNKLAGFSVRCIKD